jgi:hypothetical protein
VSPTSTAITPHLERQRRAANPLLFDFRCRYTADGSTPNGTPKIVQVLGILVAVVLKSVPDPPVGQPSNPRAASEIMAGSELPIETTFRNRPGATTGLLPQPGGFEASCVASGLELVGASAEGTGRGSGWRGNGQLLYELAYFLIGHRTK